MLIETILPNFLFKWSNVLYSFSSSGWHNFEQTLYIAHAKYICYNNIMARYISTVPVGAVISDKHAALYFSHLRSFVSSRSNSFVF